MKGKLVTTNNRRTNTDLYLINSANLRALPHNTIVCLWAGSLEAPRLQEAAERDTWLVDRVSETTRTMADHARGKS
jgi:hypothetical protein